MDLPNININIDSSSSQMTLEVPFLPENKEKLTTSEKKLNYHPLKFPPNIQMAKNHSKANRVSEQIDIATVLNDDKCECCNKFIENKQLPLDCNLEKLYHLGFCFPLYFHFVKYCIVVVFMVLCISGIFGLFYNYNSYQNDFDGIVVNMDDDNITWYFWLNLFTIVIIIISFQIFREHQTLITHECNKKIISPSNYTLIIRGLYGLCYTEEEIKKFLQERMMNVSDVSTSIEELNIRKVILTYNIEEFTILIEKRYKILGNIEKIRIKAEKAKIVAEKQQKTMPATNIKLDKAKKNLEKIENSLIQLGEKYKKGEYPLSGTILVIMNHPEDVKRVIKV